MSRVLMIVGYPAAGKSSITKPYISEGFVCLNRDKAGGKIINLVPKMITALKDGKDVILDNTFPTIESRKPFIEAAKKMEEPVKIKCIWLKTSIEDAQFNACIRMMEQRGKILSPEEIKIEKSPNLFPPVVLFKYKKEFQKPTVAEGFNLIEEREFVREFPSNWTNKAVLLDYDGTLRVSKNGNKWPVSVNDIALPPHARQLSEALDNFKNEGYIFLGATNQSIIAKGTMTEREVIDIIRDTNAMWGLDINYTICPHRVPPINCYCRKPMPGMAVEFFYKYKLDPRQCIMIGDMTSDKTFAKRSHMQFMHVDKLGVPV